MPEHIVLHGVEYFPKTLSALTIYYEIQRYTYFDSNIFEKIPKQCFYIYIAMKIAFFDVAIKIAVFILWWISNFLSVAFWEIIWETIPFKNVALLLYECLAERYFVFNIQKRPNFNIEC